MTEAKEAIEAKEAKEPNTAMDRRPARHQLCPSAIGFASGECRAGLRRGIEGTFHFRYLALQQATTTTEQRATENRLIQMQASGTSGPRGTYS